MTGPLNVRRHPRSAPVADPAGDARLGDGIRLFNEGHHWHAHEAWEPLWMGLEGDDKLFLQGLIMAAAMLHQYRRGVAAGVRNHWANVELRLQPHAGGRWGVDVAGLLRELAAYADSATGPPPWPLDPGDVRIRRRWPGGTAASA